MCRYQQSTNYFTESAIIFNYNFDSHYYDLIHCYNSYYNSNNNDTNYSNDTKYDDIPNAIKICLNDWKDNIDARYLCPGYNIDDTEFNQIMARFNNNHNNSNNIDIINLFIEFFESDQFNTILTTYHTCILL